MLYGFIMFYDNAKTPEIQHFQGFSFFLILSCTRQIRAKFGQIPDAYASCLPNCSRYPIARSKDTPIFSCILFKITSSSRPSSCPISIIIYAFALFTIFSDSVSIIVPPIIFTNLSSFSFPFVICVIIVFTNPIRSNTSSSDNSCVLCRRIISFLKYLGKIWAKLDFFPSSCYTIKRCKSAKTKVYQGLPPIPGVK